MALLLSGYLTNQAVGIPSFFDCRLWKLNYAVIITVSYSSTPRMNLHYIKSKCKNFSLQICLHIFLLPMQKPREKQGISIPLWTEQGQPSKVAWLLLIPCRYFMIKIQLLNLHMKLSMYCHVAMFSFVKDTSFYRQQQTSPQVPPTACKSKWTTGTTEDFKLTVLHFFFSFAEACAK